MNNVKKFLDEIKIYDCQDMTKMRIGNKGDGGYVVLKEICEKTDTVYSVGIGNDVGFEIEFSEKFPKSQLYLFDPTIDDLPICNDNLYFYKTEFPFSMVKQIDSLLKIDIEWDEWEALKVVKTESLKKFSQILIELHLVHVEPKENLSPYFIKFYQSVMDKINDDLFDKYYKVMQKLNKYFYIFHAHANNSLPVINVGGYKFPPLIELSLVRKDLVNNVSITKQSFPVEGLDYRNKNDRPDIYNWYSNLRIL